MQRIFPLIRGLCGSARIPRSKRPRPAQSRPYAIFYVRVAVANGACCRRTFRLIRRSTITFEAGGSWGHGTGYTTDCAAMCGKHMAAIGSRALELSTQGFQVLQWRWIVERTFGWLNRSRRLSKDFEALPETTEAWIRIAMIQLMIRRLAVKK